MKKLLYLLAFLLVNYAAQAQSYIFTINEDPTPDLTMCLDTGTFSVRLRNSTAVTQYGIAFTVTMKNGMLYIPGSVTGARDSSYSNLSVPIFYIDSIVSGGSDTITFKAKVNCTMLALLRSGGLASNIYKAQNINGTDAKNGEDIDVAYASLNILTLNNGMAVNRYQTYTRKFIVQNAGYGRVTSYTVKDYRATTGIVITGVNTGTLSGGNTTNATIFCDTNTIKLFGNHDIYFDPNEIDTIVETFYIADCSNTNSLMTVGWGCCHIPTPFFFALLQNPCKISI